MAITFDMYINGALVSDKIGELLYELTSEDNPLNYETEFTWRIDIVNEFGIAEGDNWTFTTIPFKPPLPTGITLVGGVPTGTASGLNNMITCKKLVVAAANKLWYES
jgi:hypothetical protein